jgi:hypothetical protein
MKLSTVYSLQLNGLKTRVCTEAERARHAKFAEAAFHAVAQDFRVPSDKVEWFLKDQLPRKQADTELASDGHTAKVVADWKAWLLTLPRAQKFAPQKQPGALDRAVAFFRRLGGST